MPEQFLAHYKVAGNLGAGRMGEVFRATDTRLNRGVAIKVLPESCSSDSERLARFRREAELLASLNHPNILIIHDMGVHEGAPFFVSELLEGQTLREALGTFERHARLPLRRALEYAQQIANGLAAAHGKNVIHRDLKPENVFLTHDGRVKILDFGLAKLRETNPNPGIRSTPKPVDVDAPTVTQAAIGSTEPGRVMGTPGYMSDGVSPYSGGAWFADNRILFAGGGTNGLQQVLAQGGETKVMLPVQKGPENWFMTANPLPDGRGVLFVVDTPEGDRIDLWMWDGTRKTLLHRPDAIFSEPVFSPTGHVVYQSSDDELWAFGITLSTFEITSKPFRIGHGRDPSVSNDGALLMNQTSAAEYQVVWVDRAGAIGEAVGRPLANLRTPRLSPDGLRVAVTVQGNNQDIWIVDLQTDNSYLLSGSADMELDPFWFPNSQKVLYRKWSDGLARVVERPIDSASAEVEIMKGFPVGLSANAKYILVARPHGYVSLDDPKRERIDFPDSFKGLRHASLSPDVDLLAYISNKTGQDDLYLVRFPLSLGK